MQLPTVVKWRMMNLSYWKCMLINCFTGFTMCRRGILHKKFATHTCVLLKYRNDIVAQNSLLSFTIHGTGKRTHRTNLLQKNVPTINDAAKPQYTVIIEEWRDTGSCASGFSIAYILQLWVLICHWASSFQGHLLSNYMRTRNSKKKSLAY